MVRDPPIAAAAPDHALGQYQAWRAPDDAGSALDLAWTSIARPGEPAAHRLLPHGEPSIALIRQRHENGEAQELDLVICGPYYKGRHYTPSPREELIAWRVKPELAAALFGISPGEFSDYQRISAPKRLKDACAQTLSLGEHACARDILSALKNDLHRLACAAAANLGPERLAATWLRDSEGQIRLRDIAARLDVSERNLRRRFTDHVGCSPKTYARHLQITAAALAAEKTADPDWAEIAAGAGFHDQPHMINAFQSEIGITPKAFHAERRALL
ncbi:helix-turn-helix transcriptional regulator [Hyphococcus sp.]|uniref:helix-turn-helix transcriptional regulator n=1 Tax=Hyphococcus sp. TaxID=2038636 RepID=UPI0035C6EA02